MYQDLGNPMKIKIQSDSSTANSLTDRLGAGQHIDTRYFWIHERVQDGVSVSRRCLPRRTAQMLERSRSLKQYSNNIASLQDWYSTDHGSHTPLQDEGDEAYDGSGEVTAALIWTETRRDHGRKRAQKQTVVNVDGEHRDGCAS